MKIYHFPLSKITFFFVLGILISNYVSPKPQTAWILLLISGILFLVFYFFAKVNFLQKVYFGFFALFLSFSVGLFTQVVHCDFYKKDNYIHEYVGENKLHLIEVSLKEKLKNSLYSQRFVATVLKIDNKESSGKILLNIENDSLNQSFQIGTRLKIHTKITQHKLPKNPNQFDYGRYLSQKSILAQVYCNISDIQISSEIDRNIWYYAAKIRNRIIENLQKSGFNANELNVAIALILGQQQDINPEILQDYQFAGAVHILSVSGLHVGILLVFINFLLFRLAKNRSGNIIRFCIIFISLWSFAILAGLSPSVIRSVTMFSFIAAGMCLNRENNIFHTLLVSLLLILVVSPSFLFDVGFQLSYVSLFFIIWVQPMLKKMWSPKNKIIIYLWDIITVSFAAQIGVFPISVYYFHQFPGLFFITNLIVLPAIGIIMGLGILVMILAFFGQVPTVFVKSLEFFIWLMNWIINKIASVESFIIQDIPFNISILIAFYLLLFGIIFWLKKPNFQKLIFVFTSFLLLQFSYFFTLHQNNTQSETIVFNVSKSSMFVERIGGKAVVFCNDSIDKNSYHFKALKSYLVAHFIKNFEILPLKDLYFFNDKKIVVIDSLGIYSTAIRPDILVLRQSPKINLDRLLLFYNPKMIVADGSNYKSYVKLWRLSCLKNKILFHATAEKGFYKIE